MTGKVRKKQVSLIESRTSALLPPAGRVLLILAGTLALACATRVWITPIRCWDLWFHLKTGEWIFRNHQIPGGDLFSWTAPDHPWMVNAWLSEVLLWTIYQVSGETGIILTRALLSLGIFGALTLACMRISSRTALPLLASFLALAASCHRFSPRPELFGMVLFAVVLVMLYQYKLQLSDRLVWLIPLGALWANLHMGFTSAVLLSGCFLLGDGAVAAFYAIMKRPVPDGVIAGSRLKKLAWVSLGVTAATLINPYSWKAWGFVKLLTGQFGVIAEWQPLWQVAKMEQWLPLALLAGTTILFLVLSRQARDVTGVLLFLVFAAMALKFNRQAAQFCLVAPVVLAAAAGGPAFRRTPAVWGAGMLLMVIAALIFWRIPGDIAQCPLGFGVDRTRFSRNAIQFINRELTGRKSRGDRLFNSMESGGWLIWNLWPERKVCFDGRLDIYGHDTHLQYVRTALDPEIGRKLAADGVDLCYFHVPQGEETVTERAISNLSQDPGWALVFYDDGALVFVRRMGAYRDVIERCEYRFANPLSVTNLRPDRLANHAERALYEVRRTGRECPDSAAAHLTAGMVLDMLGKQEEAAARLKKARSLTPSSQSEMLAQIDGVLSRDQ